MALQDTSLQGKQADSIIESGIVAGQAAQAVCNPDGSNIAGGGGGGGSSQKDQAEFTVGTTLMQPVGGLYETSPTQLANDEVGTFGADINRNSKVTMATALSNAIDTIDTTWYGIPTSTVISTLAVSTSLLVSNATRHGFLIINNDAVKTLYLRIDGAAATTSDIPVVPGEYFEMPRGNYVSLQAINGIASAGGGLSTTVIEYI